MRMVNETGDLSGALSGFMSGNRVNPTSLDFVPSIT